jgi:hypothetical protein
MVVGSVPDVVQDIFSFYLIIPAAVGPDVYSASNIIEYQSRNTYFWGVKRLPVSKADNLAATYESNVYIIMWDL